MPTPQAQTEALPTRRKPLAVTRNAQESHSYSCHPQPLSNTCVIIPGIRYNIRNLYQITTASSEIVVSDTRRLALNCVWTTKVYPLEMTA
jgi:hypothetical protein